MLDYREQPVLADKTIRWNGMGDGPNTLELHARGSIRPFGVALGNHVTRGSRIRSLDKLFFARRLVPR